jgi:hypothetical protein
LDKAAADYNRVNPTTPVTPDNLNLVLDITVFDEEGYKIESGFIVPKDAAVERNNNLLVKGVRFMLNDSFNPNDSDWVTVNKIMPTKALNDSYANDFEDPNGNGVRDAGEDTPDLTTNVDPNYRKVSVKPMLVQKQRGALYDKVAIAFETLDYTKLKPQGSAIPTSLGPEDTVKTMIATYCINCHSSFAADADRTQFVVKNPTTFRLDSVKTFSWLFSGVDLGNGDVRNAAHVRRSHERMMRPPVRLPAGKGGGLAVGGGAEGSAIYRVWRYQERVPAEMRPYVEAISTGTVTANQLFDKFKAFINGQSSNAAAPLFRAEVTDTVKPRLAAVSGIDDNVGNGTGSFGINFEAFDDVSRVEKVNFDIMKNSSGDTTSVDVFGDPNGAPMSDGSMGPNPRRFDGSYPFNTADFSGNLKSDNFKFVAQAEDESGNLSETLEIDNTPLAAARDNIQRTIGNCDVRIGPQGADSNNAVPLNSLTVGVPVSLTAHAQNLFGAMVGTDTPETVMMVNENGTMIPGATVSADLALRAELPGTATYTPSTTQNRTISVNAFNRIKGSTDTDPILVDPYSCTKSISFSTNVSNPVMTARAAGFAGFPTAHLEIAVNITSVFTGGITVQSMSERRVNDATNYIIPVSQVIGSADGFGNANRTLIYRWPNTQRDGNPHVFTISTDFGGRNITIQITAN